MATKTNISCRGDQEFKDTLVLLSLKYKRQIGDLVREAIDEKFGDDLANLSASFFAQDSAAKHPVKRRESA